MNAEKCGGLLDLRARPCERLFSRPSVNRFVQVVSALFSGCPISVVTACRKNPFPSPPSFLLGVIAFAGGRPKWAFVSKRLCENRLRRARKKSGVLQTPGSDIFRIGWRGVNRP